MENPDDEKKEDIENEPKIYGDYEILKPIGRGKFAVVYRAKRISDEKIVALKRISVDMIDEKARDKCLKEVRLLQSLDHPNIIKYYDSFINETDQLIIIVEWAAAGDLKRQLRKAQEKQIGFEERIIWKYFSQIADAIQHMHDKRIMHRDLKPANILLTLDGTVKVGDLGLSRELSENTYQAHSKVGTPLYMSPEVLRGDGYDFKSDIWSIGCLLYELAMLKSPFKSEGLNMFSLFQKISQGEYSPLPDRYSDDLRNLAYAMISTDPKDRPDISEICEIARNMRAKCNEEYMKGKKLQNTQKSLNQSININSLEDRKQILNESVPNSAHRNTDDTEDSDENQRENRQNQLHNPLHVNSSIPQEDISPKTAGRPISSAIANRSFGGDSDDSDATQDRKSKKNSENHHNYIETSIPANYGSDKYRQSQANGADSKKTYSKPTFIQKSHIDERDEGYIPYTTYTNHNQRQTSQLAQPSRRIKEKVHDQDNPRREQIIHRPVDSEPNTNDSSLKRSSTLENVGVAMSLIEQISSKLMILGFPFSDRNMSLSCLQFVCELGLLYGNKNRTTLSTTQFGSFVHVSLWLIEHSQSKQLTTEIDVDHDPPPMITKRLLNLAQECGLSPSILAEINPSSLVQGYGEKVCCFLNILADHALKFQKHSWKEFVYPQDNTSLLQSQPLDSECEDIVEEDVEGFVPDVLEGEISIHEFSSANLQKSLILPTIDAVLWREETERVTSLLRLAWKEKNKGEMGWVANIETLKHYSSQTKSREGDDDVDISTLSLIEMISMLQKTLLENLSGIIRNETFLNSDSTFSSLAVEYAGLHEKLIELENRQRECTKSVSMYSNRLGEIQDILQETLEQLALKTGETDSGDGNSTVINLKRAIKSLKEESRDLHLRTGLLHSEILDIRKSVIREKAAQRQTKRKKGPHKNPS